MTVNRTREIFGKNIENLTDSEVLFFIQSVGKICDSLLEMSINYLTKQRKNGYDKY
jgi:hypothetical protein